MGTGVCLQSTSALGRMFLVAVGMFMISYSLGWGAMPWVYPAEIFPMDVKEKALSMSTFLNWTSTFAISFVIQFQLDFFKVWGTFLSFTVGLIGSFVYVLFFVPEVRGLGMQDIDRVFGD